MSLKMANLTDDCMDFNYNGITLSNSGIMCSENINTCQEASKSECSRFNNILNIYKNKKIKEAQDKADIAIGALVDEDKYAKILKETIKKIRDESEDKTKSIPELYYRYYVSSETDKKIMNVILKKDEAIKELKEKIEEVKALLELTDTFQEAQSILKKYEIID